MVDRIDCKLCGFNHPHFISHSFVSQDVMNVSYVEVLPSEVPAVVICPAIPSAMLIGQNVQDTSVWDWHLCGSHSFFLCVYDLTWYWSQGCWTLNMIIGFHWDLLQSKAGDLFKLNSGHDINYFL